MADRKKEVKEAQKAGESTVANKFASDATPKNAGSKTTLDDTRKDMFSLDYEAAKQKYGQKGQSNNLYFMPKDQFERAKADRQNKQGSLAAQRFADYDGKPDQSKPAKKEKIWADVKSENGNDPAKIADYLNSTPDYKPGELTKKGMAGMGYKQGEDGKWTVDNVLDEIDKISASDETVANAAQSFTNPETGDVDEGKANDAINKYEQKLVELGAATYDKDGNFILKPTSKGKGWETWATLLSVGLSVIGIAMGVPIIPINFKAITGKDSRDAQIQALQTQYMNIKSDSAKTVDQMNADVGAGQIAQNNPDALAAQEKHAQATATTKDVIGAQTGAEKELIDKQTETDMKKAQQQLQANEKIARLEMQHAKEMTMLSNKLSTASAKEVTAYSKTGWLVDYIKTAKAEDLSDKEIALAMVGLSGVTPTQMGLKNAESIVGMVTGAADSVSNFIPGKK